MPLVVSQSVARKLREKQFIAKTNAGRELKIIFVLDGDEVHLKTAYGPNDEERKIYATKAR